MGPLTHSHTDTHTHTHTHTRTLTSIATKGFTRSNIFLRRTQLEIKLLLFALITTSLLFSSLPYPVELEVAGRGHKQVHGKEVVVDGINHQRVPGPDCPCN